MTSVPKIGLSQATPTDSEYFWQDWHDHNRAECRRLLCYIPRGSQLLNSLATWSLMIGKQHESEGILWVPSVVTILLIGIWVFVLGMHVRAFLQQAIMVFELDEDKGELAQVRASLRIDTDVPSSDQSKIRRRARVTTGRPSTHVHVRAEAESRHIVGFQSSRFIPSAAVSSSATSKQVCGSLQVITPPQCYVPSGRNHKSCSSSMRLYGHIFNRPLGAYCTSSALVLLHILMEPATPATSAVVAWSWLCTCRGRLGSSEGQLHYQLSSMLRMHTDNCSFTIS